MHTRGKAVAEIALALKIHRTTVYAYLRQAGIKPNRRPRPAPLADRERVLQLASKHGAAKAAEILGVKRQAIYLRVRSWSSGA